MKKVIKITGFAVGLMLLLVVAAAIALPFIVDPNDYKPEITQAVKQHTGRVLSLKGDIKLSVFPWLGLELGETQLSNARGFGNKPFISIQRVSIKVKLLPLLRKQVVVDKIILDGMQLNLARNRSGTTNWDDLLQSAPAPSAAAAKQPDSASADSAFQVGVAGIDISRGQVRWSDATDGSEYRISNLELQADHIVLGEPMQLHIGFDVESGSPPLQTRVDLDTDVLFDPDTQRLEIGNLKLEVAGLTLTASITGKKMVDSPQFSGTIKLATFNARKFLADIGSEIDMQDASALTRISMNTQFAASTKSVSLKKLKLQLDDSTVSGSASARLSATPSYQVSLVLDEIDIDRYLPSASDVQPKQSVTQADSSSLVIPVSLLRELKAKGTFKINKMKAFGIRSSHIVIPFNAGGGVLTVGPSKAQLYKGKYRGNVRIDVRKGAPRFQVRETLTGVQVGPLLKDAGIFDKFSGQGNVSAKITARGLDVDDILNTVNGTASFRLKNGRVKGLNLYKMVQDAKGAYTRSQGKAVTTKAQVDESMEYAHTSGTFKIKNGVITNNDLKMSGPYTRVTGKGTADLPRQRLDYRLQVTLSEDGKKGGTTVPVRVYGKLTDPNFSIEWQTVLKKAVQKEVKKKIEKEKTKIKKDLEKRIQEELRKRFKL